MSRDLNRDYWTVILVGFDARHWPQDELVEPL